MLFSDELLAYLFETYNDVSILVVMDAVLRLKDSEQLGSLFISLNPCCNGCCSQTPAPLLTGIAGCVSILVVMDAVLRRAFFIPHKV